MEEPQSNEAVPPSAPDSRVLAVSKDAAALRLVRETLGNFTETEAVDATSDAVHAFELALRRPYSLFVFGIELPVLDGPLLYELISKAYAFSHGPGKVAPGVLYLAEKDVSAQRAAHARDARVKGVLGLPIKIDRLLEEVQGTLRRIDKLGGGSGVGR